MNEAKQRTVIEERDQLRQEIETLKYRVTVLNDIGGEDHLLRCQVEEKLAAVEAELELTRKVADAAVAAAIASSAESKLTRMTLPDWRDEDARVISIHACHTLMVAEEHARLALDEAVREYRKMMEGENDC